MLFYLKMSQNINSTTRHLKFSDVLIFTYIYIYTCIYVVYIIYTFIFIYIYLNILYITYIYYLDTHERHRTETRD